MVKPSSLETASGEIYRNPMPLQLVLALLWAHKKIILIATLSAAIISYLFSAWLPNTYVSTALLRPKLEEEAMGRIAQQYSGLAALTGISLSTGAGESKTKLALEVLQSRKFSSSLTEKHGFLPVIFAAKDWNWKNRSISIDPEIYDSKNKVWTRAVGEHQPAKPDSDEIQAAWNDILTVSVKKNNGFIELSAEHISPDFSKHFLETIISDLNEELRLQKIKESERLIRYLESEIQRTKITEIKGLLAELLKTHMESDMLARLDPDYAFAVIDPPTSPNLPSGPNRLLIIVLGALLGGSIAALTVWTKWLLGPKGIEP